MLNKDIRLFIMGIETQQSLDGITCQKILRPDYTYDVIIQSYGLVRYGKFQEVWLGNGMMI